MASIYFRRSTAGVGPEGRELLHWGNAGLVVAVQTEPTFTPGNPEMLFDHASYSYDQARNYAIASGGERFLMIKDGGSDGNNSTEIVLVQNWFEELREHVPTSHSLLTEGMPCPGAAPAPGEPTPEP